LENARKGEETDLTSIREFLFGQQEKYLSQEIEKFEQGENRKEIEFKF